MQINSTNSTMTDYNKVIRSFINFELKAGFTLASATDGCDDSIKNPSIKEAADCVCSCDEGALTFEKGGYRINAYAVLGNEEYCTIADAGWKKDTPAEILKEFDDAWDAFTDKWDT